MVYELLGYTVIRKKNLGMTKAGLKTGVVWIVEFYYRDQTCFSCINIHQVPREVLKIKAGDRGFQHLPRDLVNADALKNHIQSLLLHKNWKHFFYISRYFLHYFISPFHRYLANAISTDYARSRAGQYKSRDGSNSMTPVRAYWELRSCALTARELPY